jgi:hypothetical protein
VTCFQVAAIDDRKGSADRGSRLRSPGIDRRANRKCARCARQVQAGRRVCESPIRIRGRGAAAAWDPNTAPGETEARAEPKKPQMTLGGPAAVAPARARDMLGVRLSPHMLRHTCASYLLMQDAQLDDPAPPGPPRRQGDDDLPSRTAEAAGGGDREGFRMTVSHDRHDHHNSDNSTSTEATTSRFSITVRRISDRRRLGGRNPSFLPTGHHEVPGGLNERLSELRSTARRKSGWLGSPTTASAAAACARARKSSAMPSTHASRPPPIVRRRSPDCWRGTHDRRALRPQEQRAGRCWRQE